MYYYASRSMAIPVFFTILGIIFTTSAGFLLHFLFQWSTGVPAAALFSAVNESIWEHLKLLYFPVLLYTILEVSVYTKKIPGFLYARTLALLTALLFIIAGFYTYTGVVGKHYLWADLALFFFSVLITFILTVYIQKWRRRLPARTMAAALILFSATALFFIFTFYPPHIGLFMDPASGIYGMPEQTRLESYLGKKLFL
ncbi:hypothetical protein HNP82_002821 [Catenibacillus scindens]|uniref:Uncharacterized protein n=1 Tax=Catenibacillus scindens TaxID=673271 RepID=A0A7W8M672_9FIRM|nr:DUF6512 family protein [Catenibacillus scindens]MBB5265674.1 hypothetical protein [Catenibacillus scindens]